MWISAVLLVSAIFRHNSEAQFGETCITPSREVGKCISIYSCAVLSNLVVTEDPEVKRYLKNSFCGWKDNQPSVCCGTKTPQFSGKSETLLPDKDRCGYQLDFDKILGGMETHLQEYPWVALLGYANVDEDDGLSFRCSGTLISKKYVLTAAHCLTYGTLVTVRLGEWNLNSTKDCIGSRFHKHCIEAVDIKIEEVKLHENYRFYSTELSNDIALIRLKDEVKFSDHIQPICLPESPEEEATPGEILWVSGWGMKDLKTKVKNNVKQKVEVPVIPMDVCKRKFDRLGGVQITDLQLCAGGEWGKDACIGDSGGPLIATRKDNQLQSYLEGIVSFSFSCGTNIPGVYTRVSAYLDWIKRNIKK